MDDFNLSHTEDRSAFINIGGTEYELVLTTRATKAIAGRYGGLENLGEKLMKSENFEMALDEIVWLLTLLANQSILIYNLKNKDNPKELLTEEEVEILTSPFDLAEYKNAITEAMLKGTKRNVESEEETESKKRRSRVTDDEVFTRLLYYGTVQMGLSLEEFWLMPIGLFFDLWTCHKQWNGIERPKQNRTIDDIIPLGI